MTDLNLDTFKPLFESHLLSNDKQFLKNLLNNFELCKIITDNCMDFLTLICDNLFEKFINNDQERVYSKVINYISENSNPKEVICVLNLHIAGVKDDSKFLILLYPLSISLQRLSANCDSTVIITRDVLESAGLYFDSLPVAHYSGLEGRELEVYIQASETQRFLRLSLCYLEFLESLASNKTFVGNVNLSDAIITNILTFYQSSLLKLAFTSPGIVAEDCRKCCLRAFLLLERLVSCVHRLVLSLHSTNEALVSEIATIMDSDTRECLRRRLVPYPSIVCILYHIFVDHISTKFPQIFSDDYKYTFSLPILTVCFRDSSDPNVLRLCLQLLDTLIQALRDETVQEVNIPFFYSLKIALTSNVNREIRGLTFSSFSNAFRKLTIEGRHQLLSVMLKDHDHYGFKGQMILLLKRDILTALLSDSDSTRCFKGALVYPLLCDVFMLRDGDNTDILTESEWILTALNMLYVLMQRDKAHVLGLDVIIDDIKHDFINPLIKGTDLCLAHYKNDVRLLVDCESASIIGELSIDCDWMNKKQKLDFLNKAILMLDLVKFNTSLVTNLF